MRSKKALQNVKINGIIFALFLSILLASCTNEQSEPKISYRKDATVLPVEGLHCGHCKLSVMREIAKVEGVEWVQV